MNEAGRQRDDILDRAGLMADWLAQAFGAIGDGSAAEAARWLAAHGVPADLITDLPILPATVRWLDPGDGFAFASTGSRALVFPISDCEAAEADFGDLLAFDPAAPDRFEVARGGAWALGEDQVSAVQLRLHNTPLQLWRNPLRWLQAGRRGVVILDHARAPHWLRQIGPIRAQDEAHRQEVAAMFRRWRAIPDIGLPPAQSPIAATP